MSAPSSVPPLQRGSGAVEVPDLPDARAVAWAAALPIAAALGLALWTLVAPLTRLLTPTPGPADVVVSRQAARVSPEPGEQALYLVCLLVPALAAWVLGAAAARAGRLRSLPLEALALAAQVLTAAAVVATVVYQDVRVHRYTEPWRWALGVAVIAVAGWGWRRAAPRLGAGVRARQRGAATVVALALALCATAALLSTAVFDGVGVRTMPATVGEHLPYTMSEFAAVLDGRTLWVDYFPQYVTFLPYLLAPVFRLAGLDVLTYTRALAALSLAGLVLQYDVLRRVTRSPWLALALYLPFVGFAFFPSEVLRNGAVANSFNYFAHAPLRYFFPWVVGWAVAWYLDRPAAPRRWVALGIAAVGMLNNLDFGVPAFGGALAAILLTGPGTVVPRRSHAARVLATAAGAVAAALLALELVTLARAGQLVNPAQLTTFQRIFAVTGFTMLPLPPWGVHWVLYGTYMAGVVGALVRLGLLRVRERAAPDAAAGDDRLADGVLLFASVFGAGALTSYVGRSHFAVLVGSFPAWALVAVLLAWRVARPAPAGGAGRRGLSAIPAALALAGLGWCAGEALPLPRPAQNLYADFPANPGAATSWFVAEAPTLAARLREIASPGEKVMITSPGGHLVAALAGLDDVWPYHDLESCITMGQVREVAERAQAQGVTKIFGPLWPELEAALAERRLPIRVYVVPEPAPTPWP